ncbi:MAG: arylsulfotransferase family protein [Nitrococcus sp.]|nr:arylsulfotransferase family protein [Nitrococcus sp.]
MRRWVLSKLPYTGFLLALIFLAFISGAVATVAAVFPSDYVRDAYRGATALIAKHTKYADPYTTDLWAPERTAQRGVTIYDRQESFAGLTLYTSGDAPAAHLISMDGEIVHEWKRTYSSIWDASAAVHNPVPDRQTFYKKAHVYPNGDLLAIYIGVGDTPWGYGMVKLDSNSKVIWKNLDRFHHDFAVADDGRIYALSHAFRGKPLEGVPDLKPPFLEDSLTIISPDGKTLRKISLPEAFNKSSEYRRMLWRIPYYTMEDPLHTNGVDVLDRASAAALAKKVPVAAPGQVLLSFRELAGGSIALLDVAKGKIVWATRGSWLSQHDPDILANGDILLFDNRGHFGAGGKTRIVELDPGTHALVWSYAGTKEHPLQSLIRGSQQRLPNGNTLITESSGGRLLEITAEGEIVWEYINPIRGGKDNERIPVVSYAQRLRPDAFTAEFRNQISAQSLAKQEHTR